jgi:hypothetical protein
MLMRDAVAFAPPDLRNEMLRRPSIGPAVLAAALLAAAACYVVPRGFDAQTMLSIEDDPSAIAERALNGTFDAAVARREIEAALAADDADLAKSFVELAAARQVPLASTSIATVDAAVAEAASAQHAAGSFASGLVTGEPSDMAGLAGTALGDLFVFGDIRDALREGSRLATGQNADELVLGLAAVGIAITGATYVSSGAAAPVRVGLSVTKAARKTGRIGGEMAAYLGRSLRGVVDWGQLKKAAATVSITEPALAIRTAREAVKVEKARGLMRLARDVGRVQSRAGTRAAFDALKIAESPREMAQVARLAEKQGGKTRAILKTVGRGAIALTTAVFDLGVWILGALLTLFALVSSLKSTTERVTLRILRRRKKRCLRFAALPVHG